MERTIKIGEQELKLRSSLLTIITYKNTFGTDLFGDVQNLDISKKASATNLTTVIQTLFQIIYALHKPFTQKSFNEFLNDFDFSIITDPEALENVSTVIGELLANAKGKGPGNPVNP